MKKVLFYASMFIAVAVVILSFYYIVSDNETYNLPPGYRIVCSTEGNKYTWQKWEPCQKWFTSAGIYNSEEETIEAAISYEEYSNKPIHFDSGDYEWEECN